MSRLVTWSLFVLAGCDGFHLADGATASSVLSLTLAPQKSCARLADGTVRCWGNRPTQMLTAEDPTQARYDVRPRLVPGLQNVVGLSSSLVRDCALHSDRTVSCWSDELSP